MKRLHAVVLILLGLVAFPIPLVAQQEEQQRTDLISDSELEEMTDGISKAVEKIRGLNFQQPVQKGIKSREELQQFIVARMHEDMPKERMQAYQKVLIRFGLLPEGTDLEKTILDFLTENIGGFYDHKSKQLFLIRDITRALQKVALSHELTHRLQDEHFNLEKLPLDDKTDDDLAIASLALVEGDAMEVMYRYVQEVTLKDPAQFAELGKIVNAAMKETESFKNAPLYLKRNLLFPYANGFTFVNHLISTAGAPGRNEAFLSPPTSSEQILHPEKYSGERDEPTFLRLPNLQPILGAEWKELITNVMGELNVQVICEHFDLAPVASIAAAGWDGDQYSAYEQPGTGQIFIAWITTWDSEDDARQFFDVYRAALIRKYPEAFLLDSDISSIWVWQTGHGRVMIQRKGCDVLVLDGFPADKAGVLKAAAWNFEKSPRPFPAEKPKAAPPPPETVQATQPPKKITSQEVDKAFEESARQLGMKGQDLKAMAEQLEGSQKSTGRIMGNKFIDEAKGFEICHPPGWSFATEMPVPMLSVAITDAQATAVVTLVTFPFGMEPLEMWMPMLEGMYGMQFQQFKKIRSGRIIVNNVSAYELLFTGSREGGALKARQIVFATPARTYVLMCAAPDAVYEAKSPGFEEIVNSFKISAPPQPPAPKAETTEHEKTPAAPDLRK